MFVVKSIVIHINGQVYELSIVLPSSTSTESTGTTTGAWPVSVWSSPRPRWSRVAGASGRRMGDVPARVGVASSPPTGIATTQRRSQLRVSVIGIF